MALGIWKTLRFLVLSVILLGGVVPYEIVRALLIAPFGSRTHALPSWSRVVNMRVRIVRQSLSWATYLRTANLFDWHMASLLHKKADRVKIRRYAQFEYKELLKAKSGDLQCEIEDAALSGEVDALWFRPNEGENVDKKKVMLYMHGGGYVLQYYDDPLYYALTARFARTFKMDVLSKFLSHCPFSPSPLSLHPPTPSNPVSLSPTGVDYRSSPTEPFPYCLQDTISAYRYLTLEKGYRPEDITIGGDSAGGNLALATVRYLHEYHDLAHGMALPGRLFLISVSIPFEAGIEARRG
ncbi:hypothetical protein FIBSPDRAFT_327739 [Athelia psychrophila]|uniref:Alpha/beta hydrolase fold-3 domain-containing protein n=1 Tax=Athelia psychrophila TaxID=1759441 RepID=A0A166QBE5_9AGAM|nr:hypothetical protein FIBSPDRAFT_327739 [Fibularhizoctonia sp. CBS 109695]